MFKEGEGWYLDVDREEPVPGDEYIKKLKTKYNRIIKLNDLGI